ncbi:MAG TPA: exodeoxyribonuclease I [Candidatus Saccharimonadales bacterium]|nr:exodeoxyribonuclease I [Candidatus Saccharimonadales bacterium]
MFCRKKTGISLANFTDVSKEGTEIGASFFFYDLETSGFSPHEHRIMQFAGQRTDMDLKPIGEPVNVLIKMTDDCLPDVDAVFITGITPQQTIAEGITEVEFLRQFEHEIATPGTVFVGYNTVRFDDEFMRCLHYRNFYDPYEWQWQGDRSRWDMLDVVRMTRALRPEGIEWPFDIHGKPTNRLELLTSLNKLSHEHAHDALSDVSATIEIARLIRNKQTKLFDYLFTMRSKNNVADLVNKDEPFVYTSGKYPSEFEKTTAAVRVCAHPKRQGALVYDLRHDPADWLQLTPEQMADAWRYKKDRQEPRLPVKMMRFNVCPAVAPLGVLDASSQSRLHLDPKRIVQYHKALRADKTFVERLCKAVDIMDEQQQTKLLGSEVDVDACMYDSFFQAGDKNAMSVVRAATPEELGNLGLTFKDQRLTLLLPLYKARNYPKHLTGEERESWEKLRARKLLDGGQNSKLAKYFARLQAVVADGGLTGHQEYLIEELKLYAESIMPEAEG